MSTFLCLDTKATVDVVPTATASTTSAHEFVFADTIDHGKYKISL